MDLIIYLSILSYPIESQKEGVRMTKQKTACPAVRKKIGKTTYIVKVHFSDKATETMNDKIKRMIRNEIQQY